MRKNIVKVATALGAGIGYLYWSLPAAAADINLCQTPSGVSNSLCGLTVPAFIRTGIQLILIAAFLLSFGFLVFGGIKYILSAGDKDATKAARGTIVASLIGLIIVLAAWALLNFVGNLFGLGNIGQSGFNIPTIQ